MPTSHSSPPFQFTLIAGTHPFGEAPGGQEPSASTAAPSRQPTLSSLKPILPSLNNPIAGTHPFGEAPGGSEGGKPTAAPSRQLIARSDTSGEDLEGYAGAGLYDRCVCVLCVRVWLVQRGLQR